MKFSKSWLQDYIVEALPQDEVIVDVLNKKAFEVEGTEKIAGDTIFDIKVLPNRAHDALGHIGMAREICADLSLTFKHDSRLGKTKTETDYVQEVAIDNNGCIRFMSMKIDGVVVGESPKWLKDRLESIGQRSINNIVDITNYVQFSLNKPMHAYDARSIKGTLRARMAKGGEKLTTLDDKELDLNTDTLVIADDEKVLGLAGIKGGKFSGIQTDTTSVILESANFSPTLTRKISQKYGIKTDASKRFENGIANSLIEEALYMTANLIQEICKDAKSSGVTDIYPKKDTPYYVGISLREINEILGSEYTNKDVEEILKRLSFAYEKIVPEVYIKETYPKLVGAKYKNPSSMRHDAPEYFSCSSLVSYLYKGIWMPSISIDKYIFSQKITKEELRFGDLVFANSGEGKLYTESIEFLKGTNVEGGMDHVAMYTGDGKIIHATKARGEVVIESLEDFGKDRNIVGYGRIADDLQEERIVIDIPNERLDVRIKEDIAEEIGRIAGFENLKPVLPKLNRTGLPHKRMFYENKIREILINNGFSEVMTYTFGNVGEVQLAKGLADDKEKLRTNLGGGLLQSLSLNLYNAPLLGQSTAKLFEFGSIFSADSEKRHLSIAIDDGAKKSNFTEVVDMILSEIKRTLGVSEIECQTVSTKPYAIEIDFDNLIENLEEPKTYEAPTFSSLPAVSYKSVSPYPFIARDIAMWVPSGTTWESIYALCSEVHNPLINRIDLFDTFSKDDRTSYAFRLVFQSQEKTLTDEEVNAKMEEYYAVFKNKGYEIR
jgi:phenylalanyl-tRNA synthetase beta subunit